MRLLHQKEAHNHLCIFIIFWLHHQTPPPDFLWFYKLQSLDCIRFCLIHHLVLSQIMFNVGVTNWRNIPDYVQQVNMKCRKQPILIIWYISKWKMVQEARRVLEKICSLPTNVRYTTGSIKCLTLFWPLLRICSLCFSKSWPRWTHLFPHFGLTLAEI